MKNMVQRGDVITFTATGNVTAGQVVVIGALLGVAGGDVATGEQGEAYITGVFELPKVSGADIKQGEDLTYDVSAAAFDDNGATPATGDITGPAAVAFEDAGTGKTTLKVRLTGVPGTVN